ncbi:HpcH/HpaI aldolase family protein [Ancylobacter mangrovi]|uniref:HpcH/HpaI aldolase family protein n=1 Tax=Ancylobacter mangrovi TaxID=2972472 RepID=UPI0021631191|nr:aldolase/citrate lyase family protein [Ancylobacter mangrovi]MCS0500790.1 aldolase/citrate lyase family protein [Ancylobacter mangrovi]
MPNVIENVAKRKLREGRLVLSLSVNQMRTPNIGLVAAACGYDAIYCDLEHNPTSLETAAAVCVAALPTGVTPICRVGSHDPHLIARVLDCGAQGVMVPHVGTAEEANAAVEAVRFPPLGQRSAFSQAPTLGYMTPPQGELHQLLNEQTLLVVMLETPEAVENADAIAAVEGIDVVHIGSTDLSTGMGVPGEYRHPLMRAAYEKVAAAAKRHGKSMGVGGVRNDPEFLGWLMDIGVRSLTGASDLGFILQGGKADVEETRQIGARRMGA